MTRHATLAALFCLLQAASAARADDGTLRLYGEPTSFTNVVDAFDDDDLFDLNASVGFTRTLGYGSLRREDPRADGRSTRNFKEVGDYSLVRNTLNLSVDMGIYRDLALFARLPVVLSDDQKIAVPSGRDAAAANADLAVPAEGGAEQVFSVPFTSPTRSGVDHLSFGVAYAVTNQFRSPELPTWLWIAELQLGVGSRANPCFGTKPDTATERCYQGSDPGTGSALNAINIETRASKRYRFAEPYAGFAFLYRWAGSSSELFRTGGDLEGYVRTTPPAEGTLTLGTAVFPWEERGRSQRLAVDVRANGSWVTAGHGYTPLTDALGTSQASSLRSPVRECPTCSAEDEFSGLTDTQSHARLGGQIAVELQAAQYVRFVLGANVSYSTPYLLTGADACNLSAGDGAGDERTGSCEEGIQNPHYRAALDAPGNRFLLDGEVVIDLFASAVAQF